MTKSTGVMLGLAVGVVAATAMYQSSNDMSKKMKKTKKAIMNKLEGVLY